MSEDTGRGQGVGVAWFLAGLGVGALVGILYAPKSGRETREDLAQRGREGSEYLRNRTRQAAVKLWIGVGLSGRILLSGARISSAIKLPGSVPP